MGDMKIADDEDEDHGQMVELLVDVVGGSDKAGLTYAIEFASYTKPPMAHSLEERCTPLKLEYDSCFNSWFEGYLEPAVSVSASPESRGEYSKSKAEEYERKCGKIWASYRDCVRVRLSFSCFFFNVFLQLIPSGFRKR